MIKLVILSLLATFLLAENNTTTVVSVVAESNTTTIVPVVAESNTTATIVPVVVVEKTTPSVNPKVYSALGDVIYNNVDKIENLKTIPKYFQFEEKIDSFVKEVYIVKDFGYAIEAGDKTLDKEEYLQKLRVLSKTNDFFHVNVVDSFKLSIADEDNELFSKTINSGLIDSNKYKSEILEYYFAHCADMNASGIVQKFLDEDEKLKKQEVKSKKVRVTKKQIQEAKIRRIREKDKAKQEALHKTLEEELIQKKKDIRKEQVEELTK